VPTSTSLFSLPWTPLQPGAREKRASFDQQVVRLLELSHGFEESDFCAKGHSGLVLEGACSLAFRHGAVTALTAGDALSLRPGPEDAHRVVVGEGQQVLLLLVEPA
jgi:uncharacterized cupin superfamily protein